MSNARYERRDTLDKLVSSRAMSEDGSNFVRKSLDPFHDFEVPLRGLPDEAVSAVIIQEVTKSFNISSNQVANWDCHIATMPELLYLNQNVSYTAGVNIRPSSLSALGTLTNDVIQTSTCAISPLIYSRAASGTLTYPTQLTSAPVTTSIDAPNFVEYFDGQKRLIGMAFEVVNSTAEIYQQGSVICYRMPQTTTIANFKYGDSTLNPDTVQSYLSSRSPPGTTELAMLYPSSKQWKAAEGCYVVGVMDIDKCKLEGDWFCPRVYTPGDKSSTATKCLATQAPADGKRAIPCKPTSFHTSGAYFTGLSPQTTLTVTVRLLIESSPTSDNSQLVVLAQPSPDYDPIAIEIYKKVSTRLPVGVPVSMNASGDFWDSVLHIIKDVSPMLSKSGIPLANMLGPGLGALAQGALNWRDTNSTKKKRAQNASDRKQIEDDKNFKEDAGAKNVAKRPNKKKGKPRHPRRTEKSQV